MTACSFQRDVPIALLMGLLGAKSSGRARDSKNCHLSLYYLKWVLWAIFSVVASELESGIPKIWEVTQNVADNS